MQCLKQRGMQQSGGAACRAACCGLLPTGKGDVCNQTVSRVSAASTAPATPAPINI